MERAGGLVLHGDEIPRTESGTRKPVSNMATSPGESLATGYRNVWLRAHCTGELKLVLLHVNININKSEIVYSWFVVCTAVIN